MLNDGVSSALLKQDILFYILPCFQILHNFKPDLSVVFPGDLLIHSSMYSSSVTL